MNTRTVEQIEHDITDLVKYNSALNQRPKIKSETATQIIAQGITHLTWKEAEDMGNAIQAKVKEGTSLTCAIQAWAAEWESFK